MQVSFSKPTQPSHQLTSVRLSSSLPQLDSIVKTNSPPPIIFSGRIKLSRNRKIAKLLSEGLISPLWRQSVDYGRILNKTWPPFGISGELNLLQRRWPGSLRPLRSLHQHLTATATAFIGRCGEGKWHHPGTNDYRCTWSYLVGCQGVHRFRAPRRDGGGRRWWLLFMCAVRFRDFSILFYLTVITHKFWPGQRLPKDLQRSILQWQCL